MTMTRYDLLLFDLDGTLVDSVPDLTTALGLMLAELGLPAPTESIVRRIVGEGQRSLVERALRWAGSLSVALLDGAPELDSAFLDDAVRRFRRHYSENLCVRTRLYDGVVETLSALAAYAPLGIATNKPGRWARALCDTLGLSPLFRWVLGEDDVGARKPDPKLLLTLCERAQVAVSQTLFVGDSRIDWRTAEAAGTDLALCTYGYADEATLQLATQQTAAQNLRIGSPQRPYICDRFRDLLPVLSPLSRGGD